MRVGSAGPLFAAALVAAACGPGDGGGGPRWAGTVDTLPSGQVVVRNTTDPIWEAGAEWQVVEELRIGTMTGEGPDLFGSVTSLTVDPAGRVWVLDGQSQDLRVFDLDGRHLRTVGRRGGGPGEFAQALRVEMGPLGNVWVMDPSNNRLSVFDTAGVYLEGLPALGGFVIFPWPGRFDARGSYYAPVPLTDGEFRVGMVRYDASMTPVDTLSPPRDPVERERFEHHNDSGGVMMAGVPYQGTLLWRISDAGTIWALLTDEYRLFELEAEGDTLRTITREFEPIPVTMADRARAREDLEWFVSQGGSIDLSKLPGTKPPVQSFFRDDEGNSWVEVTTNRAEQGHVFDVFDGEGRYLGVVHLPFPLSGSPFPILRNGALYGIVRDEMDVTYVVRARVVKEPEGASAGGGR
ncbi:MAG: 6-bladed beta-propeller [Longimicrobiales bacterium]